MVKFEKLNAKFSSPVEIPFYGELITSRWGYEALCVKQFKDNLYEKNFYMFDQAMSQAKYKKDYLSSELKGKLENIKSNIKDPDGDEKFSDNIKLVYNELYKEGIKTPSLAFDKLEMITPDKITEEVINEAYEHVEKIRLYYVQLSNNAKKEKDKLITYMQSVDSKGLLKLKNDYGNEALEEFVTNKNETMKIVDYKNEVYQKLDPIYMEPSHKFIKAHFYAPTKNCFGRQIDTYWINVIVIWVMTFVLYLILYFRTLKKILEFFGSAIERNKDTSNDNE